MSSRIANLACATACLLVAAVECTGFDSLTVGPGESVMITAPGTNNALTVHGSLGFDLGGTWSGYNGRESYTYFVLSDDLKSQTTLSVAPDPGDVARLGITNCGFRAFYSNGMYGTLSVGANGGGNAHVSFGPNTEIYLLGVRLEAAAQTDGDVFDLLEHGGAHFWVSRIENLNTKPFRITYTSNSAYINAFGWNGGLFSLPNAGGDIILQGSTSAPVRLYCTMYHTDLFTGTPQGMLLTTGNGPLYLHAGGFNGTSYKDSYINVNSTNVVWGHAGDTICEQYMTLRTSVDNALPWGPQTGNLVLRSSASFSLKQTLDLFGKSQKVNGLVLENGSQIVCTNGTSTITFGDGDADGKLQGDVDDANVMLVKTGGGTLELAGGTLRQLTATGGVLYVSGITTIGTLSATNMTLAFKNNDASLLTVGDLRAEDGTTRVLLQDGIATNCVFTSMPALAGTRMVKDGAGYTTYFTPADAHGADLHVAAGVLRMGGAAVTDTWWRFIAKRAYNDGKSYTMANGDVFNVWLGLGTLGIFTPEGFYYTRWLNNSPTIGKNASELDTAECVSAKPYMSWNTAIATSPPYNNAKDPILGGATADAPTLFLAQHDQFGTSNAYDIVSTGSNCFIWNWAQGMLFTNAMLVANDPSTWETVTWRYASAAGKKATSYSLQRLANFGKGINNPNVTDWELQSSPDGVTWQTLDERSGEVYTDASDPGSTGLNAQFHYTYNNHVPYLFKAKNADWSFSTFGKVRVDAGATLELSDLPEANIAFNALEVDVAVGGGTLTRFAPAADGALYLTGVTGKLPGRLDVPLTVGKALRTDNLSSWKVYVNGVRSPASLVMAEEGRLVVATLYGTMMILR